MPETHCCCSTPLAQEGGLTAANPEWMNQWDLHSCDMAFCNNLKLTPAESVLMFIWKPFDLIIFLSVLGNKQLYQYYLNRKVFSLYQFSSFFCVFSPAHGLQKKNLSVHSDLKPEAKGKLLLFYKHAATSMAMAELWSACSSHWKSLCSGWMHLQALLQSASTHQQSPNHLPKSSHKLPATVCLKAEYEDCIDIHCGFLL